MTGFRMMALAIGFGLSAGAAMAQSASPYDMTYAVRDGKPTTLYADMSETSAKKGTLPGDAKGISLLIGDSSGGESFDHMYGLAAEARRLFFITAHLQAGGDIAPTCRMQPVANLGPNLVLGADGTLINVTVDRKLQAIVPAGFATNPGNITLTQPLLDKNNRSTFRTPAAISTAADLRLGAGTEVILVAGVRVVFSTGLRIAAGANLRARVGF